MLDIQPLARANAVATHPERIRRARLTAWVHAHSALLVCGVLTVIAVALRAINLSSSYDIFIDEVSYLRISQNVAAYFRVDLYGSPFYLHPPGFFLVQGAFISIAGVAGDATQQVIAVRWLSVAFAGGSAAALFLIGRRVAGITAGVIAASLYALDPLLIRTSSRNLLEAATTFWVLLGLWVLVTGISRSHPLSRRRCVAAGAALGAALLTKETSFFITVVPLVGCALLGWSLPRRRALLIVGSTLATYSIYPLSTLLTGDFSAFAQTKLHGAARLAGLVQESGFHAHGAPSFTATIVANLSLYGPSYLIMALALPAGVYLIRRGGALDRLVAAWTASAFGLLGYAVLNGALEEQMFYFLMVPATLALAVATAPLLRRKADSQAADSHRSVTPQRLAASALAVVAAGIVLTSSVIWAQVHLTPDNGYETLVSYVDANLPLGSRMSVTAEPAEFVLPNLDVGKWATVAELRANHAEYVLTSSRENENGYGIGSPEFFNWVSHHSTKVFSFTGRSYGELSIYKLTIV